MTKGYTVIRQCGRSEEDAAFVGLLYRASYYAQQAAEREGRTWEIPDQDPTQLIVAKARHQASGIIPLAFLPAQAKFTDVEDFGG